MNRSIMGRTASLVLAASIALLAWGCGESPAPGRHEVRDSAGVRIVLTSLPDRRAWRVDSVPFVDIGTVEGANGQDLSLAWASRRLADGRIVLSNARTNELRFYSADGAFIRATGGAGEGPGEFDLIAAIFRGPGDSLIVSDASLPRLNLFDSNGDFGRIVVIEPIEGRLPRLRGFDERMNAVYRVTFYESSRGRTAAVRDTFLVVSRPLDGGEAKPIGRFPAAEHFNQVLPTGSVAGWNLPFGRQFHTAFGGGLLWIGVSDRYEIQGYDAGDGTLRRIIRIDREPAPVGQAEREHFLEHQLSTVDRPEDRRAYLGVQEVITFPATLPAYGELTNDTAGNLWIRDYTPPWHEGPRTWRVFDPDGVGLARVDLPVGLDVHDIGEDYVMGMWQDELDVEHIRAYRLHRQSGR